VPGLGLAVGLLAILTLIRLVGLSFSSVDLFFDEAQYWAWSREPAFGYFSKPPLLAWTIALASASAAARGLHPRTSAALLFRHQPARLCDRASTLRQQDRLLRRAHNRACNRNRILGAHHLDRRAVAVLLGAGAARLCQAAQSGDLRWGVTLGVALGLGLLAKYAMIYFLLGIAIATFIDRDARVLMRSRSLWLALPIALIIIAPNILWNVDNGLATFRHTGDNIQGGGIALDPLKGLEFIAAQFIVFGPIVFAVLLSAFTRIGSLSREDRLMLVFALPPLVLVTATGFVTRSAGELGCARLHFRRGRRGRDPGA